MRGDPFDAVTAFVSAALGTFLMSAALTGYLLGVASPVMRVALFVAGILLFLPDTGALLAFHWSTDLAGLALGLLCLVCQWRRPSLSTAEET